MICFHFFLSSFFLFFPFFVWMLFCRVLLFISCKFCRVGCFCQKRHLHKKKKNRMEKILSSPLSPPRQPCCHSPHIAFVVVAVVVVIGAWQGVAMGTIKFHAGLPCPTLLRPAFAPPQKRPYGRSSGGPPARRAACRRLLPFWTPHAVLLWSSSLLSSSLFLAIHPVLQHYLQNPPTQMIYSSNRRMK
jgi:hypothetical protein